MTQFLDRENVRQDAFDYLELDPRQRKVLQSATDRITCRMKRTLEDVLAMGHELLAVKRMLQHGQFGRWIKQEFGWTDRTARNLMAVAEQFGETEKISELHIDPSAAYLLSSPSASPSARAEALHRARQGERITHAVAREVLQQERPCSTPTDKTLATKDELLESLAKTAERVCNRWPEKDLDDVIEYMDVLKRRLLMKKQVPEAGT